MIRDAIERLASLGIWAPGVTAFLQGNPALDALDQIQTASAKSDDETVLVFLASFRFLNLTVLDDPEPARLDRVLAQHRAQLLGLSQTRRVQANVAARALPVLELLGRFGAEKAFVFELGCSFGLLGRVLLHARTALGGFDRYFSPAQQRPETAPEVSSYRGLDLSLPDERWLLACIPSADLRARTARLIADVPAGPHHRVTEGSALDAAAWPSVPQGVLPVVLTSFMLYQLPGDLQTVLRERIGQFLAPWGGRWINFDVVDSGGQPGFVAQVDGTDTLRFDTDLCTAWAYHG